MEKQGPSYIPVGVQSGVVIVEDSLVVPRNIKHRITIMIQHTTPRNIYTQEKLKYVSNQKLAHDYL